MSVELTAAQAHTIADLAEREGAMALHQLDSEHTSARGLDVYATPHGTNHGYRISADGEPYAIDKTLPAAS